MIQSFVAGYPNLIIIDPDDKINWEDALNRLPCLSVDLSQLNYPSLEDFIINLSSNLSKVLLIKNIDKIPVNSDKEYWETIITIGLKGEEYPITIETKDGYYKTFNLPFDRIRVITTCSQYPDYLKDKGMLGYILDLSDHDSEDVS